MSAADPAGALAGYLLAQVGSLVGGRVFRPELPESEEPNMPRPCIVVRRAGGYALFGGSNLGVGDPRLDVFCYSDTQLGAQNLAAEVVIALKGLRRQTVDNATLNWARISAGPLPLIDPDTSWPSCLVSAQVMHVEQATA